MALTIPNQFRTNPFASSAAPFLFNSATRNTMPSAAQTAAPGIADQFTRSSASGIGAPNTYSAAQSGALRSAPGIGTIAERQQAAKDYDAILENLRKQYSEPEAMRRFDEIMRADGFERLEYSDAHLALPGSSTSAKGMAQYPIQIYPGGQYEALKQLPTDDRSTNMVLQSSLASVMQGDEVLVAAESWAVYGAERPYSDEMRASWQNRYKDAAQKQAGAGFDLDAFMAGVPDADQRSAVSASSDIADMASDILRKNGVTLGDGEYLQFGIAVNDKGKEFVTVGGNWDQSKYQQSFSGMFSASGNFLSAIKSQMANPPVESPSKLGGEFADGARSLEYSVSRSVIFSADNPSAAVTNDYLGMTSKGYTYVKKAGDYFDPEAGSCTIYAQQPMTDIAVKGHEQFVQDNAKHQGAVNKALADMLETGEPFAGQVPRSEVDNAFAVSRDAWLEWNDSVDWYSADTGEIIDHAGDGKHFSEIPETWEEARAREKAKLPKEPETPPEPMPNLYLEAKETPQEIAGKLPDFRKIIADLNSRYSAIDELLRVREKRVTA